MHNDALLKSRGTTVDIGYSARETKTDWPLMRHNNLHVVFEYALISPPPQKRLVGKPQLATAKWLNQKYGKPLNIEYYYIQYSMVCVYH